ncbi:sensor domain-containing diguanylate cyclase [Aurantiacibacter sp. D1-12]|uniref:sensor domain-containing diguanylate cyclase n=1 Tax=Aurantiacibacter sp. D1-12 TaxID=2993658 RepID=UPI00237C9794|nr:diguanylate cyclase [Aurantiacibacter sp. D1-12]MDE1467924.1 diguanylate cyclase [Aurantiacibacter sp. D1-12]
MNDWGPSPAIWRNLRTPLLFGCLWALLAVGSLALRDGLGAALLIWAPSGVAVAAYRYAPRKDWLLLSGTLFAFMLGTSLVMGGEALSGSAYTLSNLVQAVVCATLSLRVLGSRTAQPRGIRDVAGLLGAAAVSCLIGALIALPFRADQALAEFAWWFLANIISILIITPILLHAGSVISRARAGAEVFLDRDLTLGLIGCAALCLLALTLEGVSLMPLLVAAMVWMAVRYGNAAIHFTLLSYVAVATMLSLGGENPVSFIAVTRAEGVLLIQSWLVTLLATALPISSMLMKRDELQFELIRRNAGMHENLMLLDLAEQMAGIGRWRMDLVTGEQEWSQRMLQMNGLPADLSPDPGDIRHLLPDNGRELMTQLSRNRHEREPFTFDYKVKPPRSPERILRISVLNEFDMADRRIALFGIAMDVTEQVHREQALDLARGRAVRLAAEAQQLANTDPLTSLPNRRCTFARLESMVDVASKHGTPLTAIMFDIDFFKAINDRHGHQTGDEVIVQVAELARRQARQGDLVGRIGGEEFVWLLPGIDSRGANALAERLRLSVERGIEGSALPNVTISIGLSQFAKGDDGDEMLARADAALYEAKEGGRNQVRRAA